jgi:phage regulator Rha-like protein
MEEHELQEAQFTAEHEEEVRALRQQKHLLMKQLEEVQQHYQNILEDQGDQVGIILIQSGHCCG